MDQINIKLKLNEMHLTQLIGSHQESNYFLQVQFFVFIDNNTIDFRIYRHMIFNFPIFDFRSTNPTKKNETFKNYKNMKSNRIYLKERKNSIYGIYILALMMAD